MNEKDNPNKVKNLKDKTAAAIYYDPDSVDTPVMTAFGTGHVAEKMLEIAEQSGVPVHKDPKLSSMLSKLSVGDEISEEMYEAVAKVLAFVAEIDRRYGENKGRVTKLF